MAWVIKTDTAESREFWSHVKSVARRVRNSEAHANHRIAYKLTGTTTPRSEPKEGESNSASAQAVSERLAS